MRGGGRRTYLLSGRVAEVLEKAQGLAVERLAGSEERGLVVERLAVVRHEGRGEVHHVLTHALYCQRLLIKGQKKQKICRKARKEPCG